VAHPCGQFNDLAVKFATHERTGTNQVRWLIGAARRDGSEDPHQSERPQQRHSDNATASTRHALALIDHVEEASQCVSVVVRMSLRTAVAHRNLLYLLSLKELRTRYRKSVLGWTWSLLNPLSQMVIFSILFLYIFERPAPVGTSSGLQNFPLYFLAGLLPFQFFSISVTTAIGSVQGGASLIKKVAFPHEHLVLSIVIAQLVTLLIELAVLSIAILIFGQMVLPWLFPMAALLVLVTMFTTGVALLLSAANVFFHDINYLWGIVAQLLFYTSPIIYTPGEIDNRWLVAITNWGPTGSIVRASQGLLYHGDMPGIGRWIHIASFSIVTLAFGAWAFNRLSPRFAEEL
jgi:ABC-type polysaccharide/polyol phosphate export permease